MNRRLFHREEKAVWKSRYARFANASMEGGSRFGIRGDPVQGCRDRAQETRVQIDLPGFVELEGVEDLLRCRAEEDDPV